MKKLATAALFVGLASASLAGAGMASATPGHHTPPKPQPTKPVDPPKQSNTTVNNITQINFCLAWCGNVTTVQVNTGDLFKIEAKIKADLESTRITVDREVRNIEREIKKAHDRNVKNCDDTRKTLDGIGREIQKAHDKNVRDTESTLKRLAGIK